MQVNEGTGTLAGKGKKAGKRKTAGKGKGSSQTSPAISKQGGNKVQKETDAAHSSVLTLHALTDKILELYPDMDGAGNHLALPFVCMLTDKILELYPEMDGATVLMHMLRLRAGCEVDAMQAALCNALSQLGSAVTRPDLPCASYLAIRNHPPAVLHLLGHV